jgi:hypothetical protein
LPIPAASSGSDSAALEAIEHARHDYQVGAWSECATRLATVNDASLGRDGRVYLGACTFLSGNTALADEQFSKLVAEDPAFDADPVTFPRSVVDRFHFVRARVLDAHGCLVKD